MILPIEEISVDFVFRDKRPGFGDLFRICGENHPNFPPESMVDFSRFDDLAVSQIDDYFGVRTLSGEGADVAVWLYPLINGEVVDHHPGPFHGIRLEYDILRNPVSRLDHFLSMLTAFEANLLAELIYNGAFSDVASVRQDATKAILDWRAYGIEPGSREAMER